MIKKLFAFTLCVMLCFALSVTAFAATDSRLCDEADLLTDSEEEMILDKLDAIYEAYEFDVVIVTVDSTGYKTPAEYADDYYDYHSFNDDGNKNGILLLLSMSERDWFVSTTGAGMVIFSDSTAQFIVTHILPYISGGNYYFAFDNFVSQCEGILVNYFENPDSDISDIPEDYYTDEYYNNGNYDDEYYGGASSGYGDDNRLDPMWIPGSIVIGMVISLLIMLGFRSQLKSVRRKSVADDYKVPGSMVITEQSDMFLYHHITRTPRQTNNNTSRPGGTSGGMRVGSSGRSHGGGGGKF